MSLIFVRLWPVAILCVAIALSLPLLVISGSLWFPSLEVWAHLASTVLSDYVINSLIVMVGVGIGTFILGVGPAWLTAMCCFPLHRIFEWALLLPLSMPAYIIAYTYTGMLDVAGPVQTALRDGFGWRYGDYWFPDVRSLGGAVVMLTLVLYPYVYLLARAAFLEQSICVLEVSRTLGCSAWQSFVRVALPLARPAIIAGLSLALMESLADYGTVQYFGVSTFTTGIFRTWFGLGEPAAAAQLSALLLLFVFTLMALEYRSRRRARYHHTSHSYRPLPGYRLRGLRALGPFIACFLPVLFGFLLPAGQLLHWTFMAADKTIDRQFTRLAFHSLTLALSAALLTLLLALIMAYGRRQYHRPLVNLAVRFAGLGYALPGTAMAIGVILPLAWIDNTIDAWFEAAL